MYPSEKRITKRRRADRWCRRDAYFLDVDELFKGRHFDREVIVLCVRWYLRFKLSYRDLVEMIAERGLSLAVSVVAPTQRI